MGLVLNSLESNLNSSLKMPILNLQFASAPTLDYRCRRIRRTTFETSGIATQTAPTSTAIWRSRRSRRTQRTSVSCSTFAKSLAMFSSVTSIPRGSCCRGCRSFEAGPCSKSTICSSRRRTTSRSTTSSL